MTTKNNLDLEDQDELDNDDELDHDDDHDDDDDDGSDDSGDLDSGALSQGTDENSDDSSDDSDGDEDPDSKSDSKEDEDREAIRARRRQERQDRKLHRKQRDEAMRNELAARDSIISQMQQQIAALSGKSINSEIAQLDSVIKQAVDAYGYYKQQIEEGTKVADGRIVAEATEKMLQARHAAEHYNNIKKQFVASRNRPPPIDARVQQLTSRWMSDNSWYDPSGSNVESRLAKVIDDSLVQEGFNPSTEAYWNELTKRCNTLLQKSNVQTREKVYNKNMGGEKSSVGQKRPKSIVAGSGTGSAAAKGNGSYRLSAERREALTEAGLWDDPKLRAEAVKRYKEYDAANKTGS